MAKIRWSVTAESDLREIEEFIAKDSVLHAVSFVDRLVESADRISRYPQAGRSVPEFNRQDLREIVYRGYRVVYLVEAEAVTILRVVHGARNMADLVRGESWDIA